MSLVPFASSTPPVAPPIASRQTATAPSPRPAAGGGPAPASTRPSAVVREGTSAPHGGKARSGFAHVLAAVQDQEPQSDAPPSTSSAATTDRPAVAAEGTTERKAVDVGDVPVLVNDLRPMPLSETQTPWLLLALGVGGWSDPLIPAPETAVSDANLSDSPSLAGPELSTGASPDLPPMVQLIPLTPTAPAPVAPVFDPAASALAAPVVVTAPAPSSGSAAVESSAGPAVGTPPAEATVLAAPVVAPGEAPTAHLAFEEPPDPVDIEDAPQDVGVSTPAPETLARWRAASRAASEGREFGLPALTPERDVEPARPGAPAVAASRLAQALGRGAAGQVAQGTPQEVTPAPSLPVSSPESAPLLPTPAGPGTRAADVLVRLSQGADGPVSRKGPEAAASATAFAQMLASAMPAPSDVPQASAPAPAQPALPPAVGDQVLAQVVSSLKMQWKDGVGEAKLHLRPDALGTVSVTLRVEAGAVTAVVRADNPQVQEWVLQHQPSLRQQMEAAGLRLDDLVVTPDDQRQSQRQSQQEPEEAPRQRARRNGDDGRVDGQRFEMLL